LKTERLQACRGHARRGFFAAVCGGLWGGNPVVLKRATSGGGKTVFRRERGRGRNLLALRGALDRFGWGFGIWAGGRGEGQTGRLRRERIRLQPNLKAGNLVRVTAGDPASSGGDFNNRITTGKGYATGGVGRPPRVGFAWGDGALSGGLRTTGLIISGGKTRSYPGGG